MPTPTNRPSDRRELAHRIYAASHLTGTFTLRSGVVSHEYFDKYMFESDPELLRAIAEACIPLVPEGIDALAGLELGGVPLATVMSQVSGLPTRFVRKEAKTYGTCRLAEGGELDGQRLCIVEDVITSGGAVLDAATELRARGAILGPVVCVIDRESGGVENLAAQGLEVRVVLDARAQLGGLATTPHARSNVRSARISAAIGALRTFNWASPKRFTILSSTQVACAGRRPACTRRRCSEPVL